MTNFFPCIYYYYLVSCWIPRPKLTLYVVEFLFIIYSIPLNNHEIKTTFSPSIICTNILVIQRGKKLNCRTFSQHWKTMQFHPCFHFFFKWMDILCLVLNGCTTINTPAERCVSLTTTLHYNMARISNNTKDGYLQWFSLMDLLV